MPAEQAEWPANHAAPSHRSIPAIGMGEPCGGAPGGGGPGGGPCQPPSHVALSNGATSHAPPANARDPRHNQAMRLLLLMLLALVPLIAQKDFLTADEADQVRLAQEPNMRLELYVKFAKQRIALLEQLVAKEKAGRSSMIHEVLGEYTKIIETIDVVSDDALRRKLDITAGTKIVAKAAEEMKAKLLAIQNLDLKDRSRYESALATAVETTSDSIELAQMELQERSTEVTAKDAKEKKALEEMLQPKDREEKRAEEKKAAEAPKKKAPTLRRKGEVVTKQP
jgi:hypothetical protein